LRAHGFTPIWSGASYVNHSADTAECHATVADAKRRLRDLGPALVERELATNSEVDAAVAAWDAWGMSQTLCTFAAAANAWPRNRCTS
jgi:hypothetical protein